MNKQQNSLLILDFWNDNRKSLIVGHMQKIFLPTEGKHSWNSLLWLPLQSSWSFLPENGVEWIQTIASLNGTFGGFFYHLVSVIYTSLFFAATFERLTKIIQSLKMIHSAYSRSYFNLLLIYRVACTHINTNLHKYKNSCDSSKERLDTKN